jgi:hypothetical protein
MCTSRYSICLQSYFRKKRYFLNYVKKDKFGATKKLSTRYFLMFFTQDTKNIIFHETWHAYIECRDVRGKFFFEIVWHFKMIFSMKRAYAPKIKMMPWRPSQSFTFHHILQTVHFRFNIELILFPLTTPWEQRANLKFGSENIELILFPLTTPWEQRANPREWCREDLVNPLHFIIFLLWIYTWREGAPWILELGSKLATTKSLNFEILPPVHTIGKSKSCLHNLPLEEVDIRHDAKPEVDGQSHWEKCNTLYSPYSSAAVR